MNAPLIIDPTLRSLIPPLSLEAYRQLEANLLADGCRDPLVVWEEEGILLDGHNRYDLCEEHHIKYTWVTKSFTTLHEAKLWMLKNQDGRRNLTPEQLSFHRGMQYELEKLIGFKGNQHTNGVPQSEGKHSTADLLAVQHKVSRATIERDATYAKAIDLLEETFSEGIRQNILSRTLPLTKQDVTALASLITLTPEVVPAIREALQCPTPAPTLHHIASAARCGICHRPLSAPASVCRGIGPICAGHGSGGSRSSRAPGGGGAAAPSILTEVQDPESPAEAPSWPQTVSSGDYEWYTPPKVLDLVREVLGQIDVDPASCAAAQAHVQARTFYTMDDDGLRQPWPGTVFCNPPYKMPEVARFVGKLYEELDAKRTTEAILLVNAATETDWFQRALHRANAVCFPDGRLHFVSGTRNGDHPCQGQALLYYGPHDGHFCRVFAALGMSTMVLCVDAAAAQLALAEAAPAPPNQQQAPIPAQSPEALRQAVGQALAHLGSASALQIATHIGVEPVAVMGPLKTLSIRGKVQKARGLYVWVTATEAEEEV